MFVWVSSKMQQCIYNVEQNRKTKQIIEQHFTYLSYNTFSHIEAKSYDKSLFYFKLN